MTKLISFQRVIIILIPPVHRGMLVNFIRNSLTFRQEPQVLVNLSYRPEMHKVTEA